MFHIIMTWWQALILLSAPVVVSATASVQQSSDYGLFIDPYRAAKSCELHVECGNSSSKLMRIVFRGNANRVFSSENPACEAVEVEPIHYVISDATAIPACTPHKADGLEVYSLELIIQKSTVHVHDDPIYVITCNYELAGSQGSSQRKTSDTELARIPHLITINETEITGITLGVRDVHKKDVKSVKVGSYIQLYAYSEPIPVSGSESFRMWNCRAFSNDTDFVEHNILVGGCGDDKVIRWDRGFKTEESSSKVLQSQSVFFRAFSLLGSANIQFECSFIYLKSAGGNGPSCRHAVKSSRKKRSAKDDFGLDLPYAQTDVIQIESDNPPTSEDRIITYTVRETDYPSLSPRSPSRKGHHPPAAHECSSVQSNWELVSLLREPLVIALISICTMLLAVSFLVAFALRNNCM